MTTRLLEIHETELGKAGLGWVLENLAEHTRAVREQVGVNDVLLYYWVLAPGVMSLIGRERAPAIVNLKEAYPKAIEAWEILEQPPVHPDHVCIVVFDEATHGLFTMRMTLEGLKNTGVLN